MTCVAADNVAIIEPCEVLPLAWWAWRMDGSPYSDLDVRTAGRTRAWILEDAERFGMWPSFQMARKIGDLEALAWWASRWLTLYFLRNPDERDVDLGAEWGGTDREPINLGAGLGLYERVIQAGFPLDDLPLPFVIWEWAVGTAAQVVEGVEVVTQ